MKKSERVSEFINALRNDAIKAEAASHRDGSTDQAAAAAMMAATLLAVDIYLCEVFGIKSQEY